MKPIEAYVENSVFDNENRRLLAGAAIAQFLVMREGLKGRMEDGGLDATAATLTAAVIASTTSTAAKCHAECAQESPSCAPGQS